MSVRPATPAEVPVLFSYVEGLANHVGHRHEMNADPDLLAAALFGPNPTAYAHVDTEAGGSGRSDHTHAPDQPVAMAIWYPTFSTWTGVGGIWLEDLFVEPAHRGHGHGRALLGALGAICVTRGWARLEWEVLHTNTSAIDFYDRLGASPQQGATRYRVVGDLLARLGT